MRFSPLYKLPAAGLTYVFLLAPAHSANATNSVGWVFANQPDVAEAYTPDQKYSFNSGKGSVSVKRSGIGSYRVTFSNLHVGQDDVLVSGYNTTGWCQLLGWDSAVEATVGCYDSQRKPANIAFTLLYQSRSASFGNTNAGNAFAFGAATANNQGYTLPSAESFNSTGGTNSLQRNKLGNFTVIFPGFTKPGGNVQVTSVGLRPSAARCNVVSWNASSSGTAVNLQCYDYAGYPRDQNFDLAYTIGEPLGTVSGIRTPGAWVFSNNPTSTSVYTPSLTYQYNGFSTGRLTAQKTGTGLYTVTIPGNPSFSSSIAVVSAVGANNVYCSIASWTNTVVKVPCYSISPSPKATSVPTDSQFTMVLQATRP